MESNTLCPRLTARIILSGSAVHVKGFGSALCSTTKRLIASCKSTTDTKTPRFNRRWVSTCHGITSLFAALDIATGRVIGKCYSRHRSAEFRRFLDRVEAAVPADLDIHVVMDNYATHKTQLIRDWFAKRPRWHVHLTPTGASWLNQVERFFALLTERQIKRGVHRSVTALEAAINAFISNHNTSPKPFSWTKTADDILASIERFCTRTLAVQNARKF
jgi:transposase